MDKVFEKWCEKLLDTGRRNNLINFKDSQTRNLDILSPNSDEIFKKISGGEKLAFYDVDAYVEKQMQKGNFDKKSKLEDEKTENKFVVSKSQVFQDLSKSISKKEILAFRQGSKLKRVAENLYRNAKVAIDERGVNILYIAFGILTWTDLSDSKIVNNSPLVLLPLAIENRENAYIISEYEDEYSTNPTLIYKFKTEYHFNLPEIRENGHEDESLTDYYKRVQMVFENFTVKDEVKIGTFSFLKLDMYKDLVENEESLLKNSTVLKLLNKEDKIETDEEVFDSKISENGGDNQSFSDGNVVQNGNFEQNEDLKTKDKTDLELTLHNVVDADSSQMQAILKAKEGESFVLQGPPGTGKSQTITNLIAEFLYDNKKVLFVSEKLAALSVVYNNLKKVGLSDFCLELHSNKSNKKVVIEQLNKMLEQTQKNLGQDAEIEYQELVRCKNILDDYVAEYHKIDTKIGKSPYEILETMFDNSINYDVDFEIQDIKNKDRNYVSECVEQLNLLSSLKSEIGYDYHKNLWFGFRQKDIGYHDRTILKNDLQKIVDFTKIFSEELKVIGEMLGIKFEYYADYEKNLDFLFAIFQLKYFSKNLFQKESLDKIIESLSDYNYNVSNLKSREESILSIYKKEILLADIDEIFARYKNNYQSIFRIFNKNYKFDKLKLKGYQIDSNKKYNFNNTFVNLSNIVDYKNFKEKIALKKQELDRILDFGTDTQVLDYVLFEQDLKLLQKNLDKDYSIFEEYNAEKFNVLKSKIKQVCSFEEQVKECNDLIQKMQNLFDFNEICFKNMNFSQLLQKLGEFIQNFDSLEMWTRFLDVKEKLESLGLMPFIDKLISQKIDYSDFSKIFIHLFYKQLIFHIVESSNVLSNFMRSTQDFAVNKFREKDKLSFEISKAKIISKLSSNLPSVTSISGSEVGILVREANKKRKQKPVRVLFKEIFPLIQRLKPCLLMSPLSVCSYLDYDTCKFDVVIFDEASQIFPWDAIGAIARAKQVIIVGDSNQMPPTDFFSSNSIEESEEDDEISESLDFESILDLGSGVFPSQRLSWHYRSKTEDLIAFSNENFYDNSLMTFPSAYKNRTDMGISFSYCENGVYNRKTRTNENEANKIVELVFECLKSHSERSLGVVTFSVAQQNLILDKISERRANDIEFEKYFAEKTNEPFFVKNLETVQGDERDTIIFSVAYARDENGKFLLNFGPLNKMGGERRLNVAVTRAKYNIILVASIKSNDIDLSRSNARGTYLLKRYLEIAEFGTQRISSQNNLNNVMHGVEKEVFGFLKENGYKVVSKIGLGELKIDIGIMHPNNDDFVLAIEFDGDSYKCFKTTRDRDRLRQEVLEKLGWKYYRMWSLEWLLNRDVEKKKLLDYVKLAINDYDRKNAKIIQKSQNSSEKPTKNCNLDANLSSKSNFIIEKRKEKINESDLFPKYKEFDLTKYNGGIYDAVYEVIKTEAPITEELLIKKMSPYLGREKVTTVVRRCVLDAVRVLGNKVFKIGDFYVVDKNMVVELRIPESGKQRDILFISNVELASGLYTIIKNSCGITEKGLFLTILNLLGFSKLGTNIEEKLSNSLKILIDKNIVKKIDDEYFLRC